VEVDHSAAVDRSAAVDHSAAVGRCVVGLDVAVGRCVARALQIGAFHGVALVEIRVALSVARSAAPNAVRKFSWGDFRSVARDVAQVAARLVVQIAARVVIPEMTQASQVARCAARYVARDCCAAGSLLPAGRAGVSALPRASSGAHSAADPAVLQAGLT
jgi:hypothetical protein